MRLTTVAPHVLLIEPSPVYALLSSAELVAAGFEVTLARSFEDGQRWAETMLNLQQPAKPTLVLVNLQHGVLPNESLPGLRFAARLHQQIAGGLLHEATIVGLLERPTLAAETSARECGCHILRVPLRTNAAQLMRRIVLSMPLDYCVEAEQPLWLVAHSA